MAFESTCQMAQQPPQTPEAQQQQQPPEAPCRQCGALTEWELCDICYEMMML